MKRWIAAVVIVTLALSVSALPLRPVVARSTGVGPRQTLPAAANMAGTASSARAPSTRKESVRIGPAYSVVPPTAARNATTNVVGAISSQPGYRPSGVPTVFPKTASLPFLKNATSLGLPAAVYDEQLGTTFTQTFTSLAYNVTAVAQVDSNGYGPAYLLNGLTPAGYWYQVGLSYHWPYTSALGGGYQSGFDMNYEAFDNAGNSVWPTNGNGGVSSYSGPVNPGDTVLLSLSFSGGNVVMYSYDWNTGASGSSTYSAEGSSTFSGSGNGFFTGLMTEWWHATPYYGGEQEALYSDKTFSLSSAYLWIDEWEPSDTSWSGAFNDCLNSCLSPQSFSNSGQLYSFASQGAIEYENAQQFITGTLSNVATTISLIPVGLSTPISPSNEFAVTYRYQGVNRTTYDDGQPLTVTPDLGTYVWFSAVTTASTPLQKWVFDELSPSVGILAGSSSTLFYYDLLSEPATYSVVDGGSLAPPTISYYTAPTSLPSQPVVVSAGQVLGQTSLSLWMLRGTTASVPGSVAGSQNERWFLQYASWTLTAPDQLPAPIKYYHQFQVQFTYSVSGGGTGYSAPTVTFSFYGQSQTVSAGNPVWADASDYQFGTQLPGSSGVERWEAGTSGTGVIGLSGTYATTYYHQFALALTYQVVGGGSPSPPQFTMTYLGHSGSFTVGTAGPGGQSLVWTDAGSAYQFASLLPGSTSSERWYGSGASGVANGYSTLTITYYHQFNIEVTYVVEGGGSPQAPILTFADQGVQNSYQMTQSPSFMWIDDNHWSATSTLGGSTATERWTASSGTNGTVSSNSPIFPHYFHQFAFSLSYSIADNSVAQPPTLTSTAYGSRISKTLGKTSSTYWLDSGAPWSVSRLLNGSSSTERWIASSAVSGTVNSAETMPFDFLHQFYVTIQTDQAGGGTMTPTAWYNATSSLELSAQAGQGWQFEGWTGTGLGSYSGSTNPQTIKVESPLVESATFYPGLKVTNGGNGQVVYQWGTELPTSVSGTTTIFVPVGTNVSLSASPSFLFTFAKYTGGVNSTNAKASIVVNSPFSVTASFSPNIPVIGSIAGVGVAVAGAAYYMVRVRKPKTPTKAA